MIKQTSTVGVSVSTPLSESDLKVLALQGGAWNTEAAEIRPERAAIMAGMRRSMIYLQRELLSKPGNSLIGQMARDECNYSQV